MPPPSLFRSRRGLSRVIIINSSAAEASSSPIALPCRALFVGRATPTIGNGTAPVSTCKSFVSGSTQADPVKRERHGGLHGMLTRSELYAPCDAPFRRSPTMFAKLQI